MSKKSTTVEFIAKAQAVHGVGAYGYSQAVYAGAVTKLTILCHKHGPFEQTPNVHLTKHGCPECGGVAPLTTARFIDKAMLAHGSRYDYSLVEYVQNKQKVIIGCRQHGPFEQKPNAHLNGQGCLKCMPEANRLRFSGTQATFIKAAVAVHGLRYDYSLVEYKNALTRVRIICAEHGEFEQQPNNHTNMAQGCPLCGIAKNVARQTFTTEEFIARAKAVHGSRYDYSLVEYKNYFARVKIICSQHGAFEQVPASHVYAGSGCPACAREQLSATMRLSWIEQAKGRACSLYFLRIFSPTESFFKVGVTFKPIKARFAGATLKGYAYEVLALHQSTNAAAVWDWEQSILETFTHLRYKPRISFEGETECFGSCDEILSIFPL